ncbi:uncharacterized protein LOC131179089 [Hevea brasiliensis]|uniref:uncharacterized protein LOC131179089 n=1 Tax=Hevea brasiliensis TaxID=3981 RepID=UPI0025F85656|nr:uncharacterized protein LOC131179089 [Hevea brasiliensis]
MQLIVPNNPRAMEYYTLDGLDVQKWLELESLLLQYDNIFLDPVRLPLRSSHDHKIILQEVAQPVNVRPYKYASFENDVIEKLIKEMLEARRTFALVTCKGKQRQQYSNSCPAAITQKLPLIDSLFSLSEVLFNQSLLSAFYSLAIKIIPSLLAKIGFAPLLSSKKRFEVGFPRKMAWIQEKCEAEVGNKLEVVRPGGLRLKFNLKILLKLSELSRGVECM